MAKMTQNDRGVIAYRLRRLANLIDNASDGVDIEYLQSRDEDIFDIHVTFPKGEKNATKDDRENS